MEVKGREAAWTCRAAALVVLALVVLPGLAEARNKPPLFGFNDTPAAFAHHTAAAHAAGQTVARIPASWSATEPELGRYDWSSLDAAVAAVRSTGGEVLFAISGAPDWAAVDGCHSTPYKSCAVTPERDADFVGFAERLLERYPGALVQSWNEPNIELFGDLSAARVASLTNQLVAALPGRVVGPSPSPADDHTFNYLSQSYRQIDSSVPLAVNLYPRSLVSTRGLRPDWRNTRAIARRDDRPIWVTEIGYAASEYGARGQAKALSWAYRYLARHEAKAIIVHRLLDPGGFDDWQSTLGILRVDGSRTPAYRALKRAVRLERDRVR